MSLALLIAADLINLEKKSVENAVSKLNAADFINLEKDITANVTFKLNESLTKHLWLNKSNEANDSQGQNVSASIRVSYNHLSEKDKVCGQYLSCFPASFTSDAAVAIVGSLTNQSEFSIKECPNTLKHLSLLQQSSDSENFHKLLKDFFSHELNSSEELQFERMFCDYYCERLQHIGETYLTDRMGSAIAGHLDLFSLTKIVGCVDQHYETLEGSIYVTTDMELWCTSGQPDTILQ